VTASDKPASVALTPEERELRDIFAAAALASLASQSAFAEDVAEKAYTLARAMILERRTRGDA
jgi:hypothetical protein